MFNFYRIFLYLILVLKKYSLYGNNKIPFIHTYLNTLSVMSVISD